MQEGPCPLGSTNEDPGLESPGPQSYQAAVADTEGQLTRQGCLCRDMRLHK